MGYKQGYVSQKYIGWLGFPWRLFADHPRCIPVASHNSTPAMPTWTFRWSDFSSYDKLLVDYGTSNLGERVMIPDENGSLEPVSGTSFAAPSALMSFCEIAMRTWEDKETADTAIPACMQLFFTGPYAVHANWDGGCMLHGVSSSAHWFLSVYNREVGGISEFDRFMSLKLLRPAKLIPVPELGFFTPETSNATE